MSQPTNSGNSTSQPGQPGKSKGSSARTAGIIGLALVAILALGFAGYTALNPHVATVTQQQMVTNTQSVFSTQTVMSTSQIAQVVTVTNTQSASAQSAYTQSVQTVQTAVTPGPGVNGYYAYCSPYGCMNPPPTQYNTYNPYSPPNPWYPGYYDGLYYGFLNGYFTPPCQAGPASNNVSCSGYIFQANNGCNVLVIPIANQFYSETYTFQYYTLHNLPSNAPSNGSWVTVTGQLYQGANTSTNGASCPGNYINVTSIN